MNNVSPDIAMVVAVILLTGPFVIPFMTISLTKYGSESSTCAMSAILLLGVMGVCAVVFPVMAPESLTITLATFGFVSDAIVAGAKPGGENEAWWGLFIALAYFGYEVLAAMSVLHYEETD